jgi:hypothetical protein
MATFLDRLGRDLVDAAGRAEIRCSVDLDRSIRVD